MSSDDGSTIPLESYPGPAAEYLVSDGQPQIIATNTAFDQAFESDVIGMPVVDLLNRFDGIPVSADSTIEAKLAVATDVEWRSNGGSQQYTIQRATPSDTHGFLLFTSLEETTGVDASVGEVASVLSHELRNPLDVAKAHLQAARETGEAEHFDAVADAHDRIAQLIQDVLTLARGPDAVSVSEPVPIQTVAEDAWESVNTRQATLRMEGSLPTPTGDPTRVQRLFENLFRNAVEHGHTDVSGDGHAPERDTPATQLVVTVGGLTDGFYVADNGTGIPDGERDAVFTPGYTTAADGTGLGLAIVDGIVNAHGWELALTTAKQGGARFEVWFQQ